jgi:hypothetical protein
MEILMGHASNSQLPFWARIAVAGRLEFGRLQAELTNPSAAAALVGAERAKWVPEGLVRCRESLAQCPESLFACGPSSLSSAQGKVLFKVGLHPASELPG